MIRKKISGLSCLLLLPYLSVFSQDTTYLSKAPLLIERLSGKITLDGSPDEPAWSSIAPLPYIAFEPVWGVTPTEQTDIRLTYDERYLYISGRCFTKDSTTIVARNLVRDGYRGDDWVSIQFDSRFDRQNALVFSVYPLGSRFDMATSNDAIELGNSTFNPALNMIWEAKTKINKDGWFFEIRIPLYNLRYKQDTNGYVKMAVSFTRAIQYKQEYHQFPAIPRNTADYIERPSVKQPVLLEKLPASKLFLLTPYVSAGRERSYQLNNNTVSPVIKNSFQAGLDAKIGISSYLTLDVSVNPDFSQAEADNQQVNLSRFSLFFPEKRLFFQEQAGLFEVGLGGTAQVFYSRRIGINNGRLTPVYGGVRLTGKLDAKTDIGLINIQSVPTNIDSLFRFPTENFGVFRLRRKVLNNRSFIGTIITSRISSLNQNFQVGFDAIINTKGNYYLKTAFANSIDVMPGVSTPLRGDASRFSVNWELRKTDRLYYSAGYTYSGKNFDPKVGFLDRSDFHHVNGILSYGIFARNKKAIFQYQSITLARILAYWNAQSGKLESMETGIGWRGNTIKGMRYSLQLANNYEYLATPLNFGNGLIIQSGSYHAPSLWLIFTPPVYKNFNMPVTLSEGYFYQGKQFYTSLSPTLNLGKHLDLKANYSFTYLRFTKENTYYPIHLAKLSVNYAFDLHFSASFNIQYNSNEKRFFNNARLRYNFADGHDLYLVWNENFFSERNYFNESLARPRSEQQVLLIKYYYTFLPLKR
ncbi:carbohydrate binding family 9 domain-containing protein [Emticicia agri]|uniref:DUF5916 domain-containing protein n=1 Tax=Emticicia agri TaxID=2492393 RepID=A0A4Q5M4M6_9BACT|nr:carbohydrate binding family 9 domain-containing protein [Emticicia agri]RYU97069.1 hypothetical protein EWM59_03940 [Emticicia agri]